jgi:hypothetical protein
VAHWVPERCCRDKKCPGAWFAVNASTHHIADDGGDTQGVFPSEHMAQEWCNKANAEKKPVTKA